MSRNTSESQPVLKCPHCGNASTDEMLMTQMVQANFFILVSDSGIEVDSASIEMDSPDRTKGQLYCMDCGNYFKIPSEFGTTWV